MIHPRTCYTHGSILEIPVSSLATGPHLWDQHMCDPWKKSGDADRYISCRFIHLKMKTK